MALLVSLFSLALTAVLLYTTTPGIRRYTVRFVVLCICILPLRIGNHEITAELLREWLEDSIHLLPFAVALPVTVQHLSRGMWGTEDQRLVDSKNIKDA